MKVLLTGATGFIGRQLCRALALEGHELIVVTRNKSMTKFKIPAPHTALEWGEVSDRTTASKCPSLKNLDAVIHLAGESIVSKRWSPAFKKKIFSSRVDGTKSVIQLLEHSGNPHPSVFIAASAVGYYGDGGSEVITESQPSGSGFLAQVCQQWESALFDSSLSETRKIALRIGVVLGKGGGALEKMIPPFRLGGAASLGTGRQWMSWIHIDDLISVILKSLVNDQISGPINACAPNPVTNREFTHALAHALRSVSVLKIPGPVLKAVLGEFASTLLASQRVVPEKLQKLGFEFQYPQLNLALESVVGDSYALGYDEFLSQCWIPRPIDEVFDFFASAHNLEAITPPWLNFKILSQSTVKIAQGTLVNYQLRLHGLPIKWRTEISQWNPPSNFMDTQLQGPYQFWQHRHRFLPLNGGTLIEDHVLYRLPLSVFGRLVAGSFVKNDVSKIFAYRSQKIFDLLS